MNKDYTLLLGAGAEVLYGMPSGAEFAAAVFLERSRLKAEKDLLKAQLGRIPLDDAWVPYRKWLGIGSTLRPRVTGVVDRDFDAVIVDGLSANRESVLDWLADFDTKFQLLAKTLLNKAEQEVFGGVKPGKPIRVRGVHDERVSKFFNSDTFRRLVALLGQSDIDKDTIRSPIYLLSSVLIGVAAGASLQGHASEMAISPLDNVGELPDQMDLAQCVPTLSVRGSSRLTETWTDLRLINERMSGFATGAVHIANVLLGLVVNYQQWIGSLYHYLFRPYDSFAKFTKAVVFMRSAGEYISRCHSEASQSNKIGFYEDLLAADHRPTVVATTNYTQLIDRSKISSDIILHLNGKAEENFEPYLQRHTPSGKSNNEVGPITIPSLFVQSAVKPFTDFDLLRRYVHFHNETQRTRRLVVIGFGFNADDGHINALVRDVLFDGCSVLVFDYDNLGHNGYIARLRLEGTPKHVRDCLIVKPINDKRQSNGRPWLDVVTDTLNH